MQQIHFNHQAHMDMLEQMMGIVYNPRADVCISRTHEDGRLLGGVIFTDYLIASIQIHVASFTPRWINRQMLWYTFAYPFLQLQVQTLFGQVNSENHAALEFDKHLGFREVTRIDGIYPSGQLVLMAMTRDECRFLKPPRNLFTGAPDGQEYSPATSGHDAAD